MKTFLIIVAASLFFCSGSFSQINLASQTTQTSQISLNTKLVRPAGNVTYAKKFQSMVGSWEIVGEQEAGGGLEIIDSANILIRFMGEEKKLVEYKIDFSKSPYWFDFSAQDSASVSNFKSIIEFVNDDMLKWQVFVDEERTNHFTSTKGELFYLKRSRPKSSNLSYTNSN